MHQPLRLGLIGAGAIAGAHVKAIAANREHVRLDAVCDLVEANARRRAEESGARAVFINPDEMLRHADLDAVVICTTHDQHEPLTLKAAAAGRHVLVEKPMACTLAEARRMEAACREAGRVLMVGQCQRYDPSYRGLKRLLDSGELGTIRTVRLDAMQDIDSFLKAGHWLYDGKPAGGGILISVAVHRIDLLRFLLGEVTRVRAVRQTFNPKFVNGAEDFCAADLEFENGAFAQLYTAWFGYRLPYSESFMIFGSDGAVHALPDTHRQMGPAFAATRSRLPPATSFPEQFGGFEEIQPEQDGLPHQNPFHNQMLHFAECCRSGQEPLSSGRDNLGTMKIISGIYQACERDGWVDL